MHKLLQLPQSDGPVLCILVINQPITDIGTDTENGADSTQDALLWASLKQHYKTLWQAEDQSVLYALPDCDHGLLVIDRFSLGRQIPAKQGVGLARKIGADIASAFIHKGNIASRWIHSTDADVKLPSDYFLATQSIEQPLASAALLYPFEHRCTDLTLQPFINLYEFKLRYYVAALQHSGSLYAFHTIGSLMCINADSYASVRGFPKRSAAEDFYLLNKLAKVGSIQSLKQPIIEVEARLSNRVPFGTGPALSHIKEMTNPLDQYCFYNPRSFVDLSMWLSLASPLWQNRQRYQTDGLEHTLRFISAASICTTNIDTANIDTTNGPEPDQTQRLIKVLQELKLETFLAHGFKQCSSEAAFQKQLMHWFDGFKTLKFIHLMRSYFYEDIRLQELTDEHDEWLNTIFSTGSQNGTALSQTILNLTF